KCMKAAVDAALPGVWRAWLSTAAVNAIDRIAGAGPWLLPDRMTTVFASRGQLASGPAHAIDQLADGSSLAASSFPVWTGSTASGALATTTCLAWAVDQGATGRAGRLDGAGAAWTDDATLGCGTYAYLYCFEQPN